MKIIVFIIYVGYFSGSVCAQPATLVSNELKLQSLFSSLSIKNTDEENQIIQDSIHPLMAQTLKLEGAFEYPFDSLRFVGKITSADKKIRIITWNLPHKNGTNIYFGFLLQKDGNRTIVITLTDSNTDADTPLMSTLDASTWSGNLVYEIIDIRSSGETLYTLLGYDPENMFVTRKIIDVLWFENEKPVFGKPIFRYNKALQNRIIFEYSAKVKMSLVWNKSMNMIVFDHLIPSSPAYAGNFQYYVPDLSFDGLQFEKGIWELHENIDPRN